MAGRLVETRPTTSLHSVLTAGFNGARSSSHRPGDSRLYLVNKANIEIKMSGKEDVAVNGGEAPPRSFQRSSTAPLSATTSLAPGAKLARFKAAGQSVRTMVRAERTAPAGSHASTPVGGSTGIDRLRSVVHEVTAQRRRDDVNVRLDALEAQLAKLNSSVQEVADDGVSRRMMNMTIETRMSDLRDQLREHQRRAIVDSVKTQDREFIA